MCRLARSARGGVGLRVVCGGKVVLGCFRSHCSTCVVLGEGLLVCAVLLLRFVFTRLALMLLHGSRVRRWWVVAVVA